MNTDLKNYGNFLTDKDIAIDKREFNRNNYLFCVHILMIFLLCGLLVEGTAWGYCARKYVLPQAGQIEQEYEKAKAANKKIQMASVDLRQAEDENLRVLTFLTLLAQSKPSSLNLSSLVITKDKIQILGESTDVNQVAKFSQQLKADNFGPARIERLSENTNLISFTVVLDAKPKDKPKQASAKAKGGASNVQ